jgi:hypothetical protein
MRFSPPQHVELRLLSPLLSRFLNLSYKIIDNLVNMVNYVAEKVKHALHEGPVLQGLVR